jgi:hypothetical protein
LETQLVTESKEKGGKYFINISLIMSEEYFGLPLPPHAAVFMEQIMTLGIEPGD